MYYRTLKEQFMRIWTGFNWIRRGFSRGLLWTR